MKIEIEINSKLFMKFDKYIYANYNPKTIVEFNEIMNELISLFIENGIKSE